MAGQLLQGRSCIPDAAAAGCSHLSVPMRQYMDPSTSPNAQVKNMRMVLYCIQQETM